MTIVKDKRQYTLRVPKQLWSWVKYYHRRRRQYVEQGEVEGRMLEAPRVHLGDSVNALIQAGLAVLCPISTTSIEGTSVAPGADILADIEADIDKEINGSAR